MSSTNPNWPPWLHSRNHHSPASSSAKSNAAYASEADSVYAWTARTTGSGTPTGRQSCPGSPYRPSTCPGSARFRAANSRPPTAVSRMSARFGTYRCSCVGPAATAAKSVPGSTSAVGIARSIPPSAGSTAPRGGPDSVFTTTRPCRAANSSATRGNVVTTVGGTGNPHRCASRSCHGLNRARAAAPGWFIQRAPVHSSIPYSACRVSAVSHADAPGARAAGSPGLRTQIPRSAAALTMRPSADR